MKTLFNSMAHQAKGLEAMLRNIGSSSRASNDQAAGLGDAPVAKVAAVPARPRCRTIAVAAGKGGVGKSSISVNLGTALSLAGKDVILLDADMGLANLDVLLGLAPTRNLGHLLDGSCGINEILINGPHGVRIVPAGSGARRLAHASTAELAAVIGAFDLLDEQPDYLIVDTAAGVGDSVALFAAAADDVLLVVCDEPASITDAYALLKVLTKNFGVKSCQMVANQVANAREGKHLYEKLNRAVSHFLGMRLDYMGFVPRDERLRQAIRRQTTIVDTDPNSPSGAALKKLAQSVLAWGAPSAEVVDRVTFFSGSTHEQVGA